MYTTKAKGVQRDALCPVTAEWNLEPLLPSYAERARLVDGDPIIPIVVIDVDVTALISSVLDINFSCPVTAIQAERGINDIIGILSLPISTIQIIVRIAGVHVSGLHEPVIIEGVAR